jgi:hypothetical protein
MVKGNNRFGKGGTEKCAVCRKMRRKVYNRLIFLSKGQCEAEHPWVVCEYCKRHRVEHLCLKVAGVKTEPSRQLSPIADDAKIPHEDRLLLEYLFHERGYGREVSSTSFFPRFIREFGIFFRPMVIDSPLLRNSLLVVAAIRLSRSLQLNSYLSKIPRNGSEVTKQGDFLALYILWIIFYLPVTEGYVDSFKLFTELFFRQFRTSSTPSGYVFCARNDDDRKLHSHGVIARLATVISRETYSLQNLFSRTGPCP